MRPTSGGALRGDLGAYLGIVVVRHLEKGFGMVIG
jgi:hypothetical protein